MPKIEYIYARDFLDNLPNGFTSYEQPVLNYKEYRAMIRFTNKDGKVYELGNLGKNYKNKGENPNQTHIHFLKDKIIYRMNNILRENGLPEIDADAYLNQFNKYVKEKETLS